LRDLVRRARRPSARPVTSATIPIACVAALLACGDEPTAPPAPPAIPISGVAVPGMALFDRTILDLMRKHDVPGGAVAVLRDGRLIYARGFGYADVEPSGRRRCGPTRCSGSPACPSPSRARPS
jgi:CubicO group peptidase (beta-lactamase class C family)